MTHFHNSLVHPSISQPSLYSHWVSVIQQYGKENNLNVNTSIDHMAINFTTRRKFGREKERELVEGCVGGLGGGDTVGCAVCRLILGAGAPGEATVSQPSNATTASLLETWAAHIWHPEPQLPPPTHPRSLSFSLSLSLFPTQSSISPGGRAHFGRGMQRLISSTWTAELGAAATRHGSISWRRHLSAAEIRGDTPALNSWTSDRRIGSNSLLFFFFFQTAREQNKLCSMRNHAHHPVSQCAAVRLLPTDLPHPHQR